MENYITEFEKKITEISKNSQNIYIVNAGFMNSGKSSVFNSLLNREEFRIKDDRETIENKSVKWEEKTKNVFLIDTPGIETTDENDKKIPTTIKESQAKAYEAYKNASMILFVHSIKKGELHKEELELINKIKNKFENKKYFWTHFCIILTKWEQEKTEDIEEIKNKLIQDIKNYCNNEEELKIFLVSNKRYSKGTDKNNPKTILVSKSGIPELREYLESNIEKLKKENQEVKKSIINREKNEIIKQIEKNYKEKENNIQKRHEEFSNNFKKAIEEYKTNNSEINNIKQHKVDILKKEIDKLKNDHQIEKSKY